MSYVNIYVHAVWRTKYNHPTLVSPKLEPVLNHILENARTKKIDVCAIGGHRDHVHALLSLTHDQSIGKVMQLIKGESSNWANKSGLFKRRFEWAEEYYAGSVSETHLDAVKQYIARQEEHHRPITWDERVQGFLMEYGLHEAKATSASAEPLERPSKD